MKYEIKLTASCVAVLLPIVLMGGCIMGRDMQLVNTLEVDINGVGDIRISYTSDSISLQESSGDCLVVREYMNQNKIAFHGRQERRNDELSIYAGARPQSTRFNSHIEIYLPKTYTGQILLHTDSGPIAIKGGVELATVVLKSTSGKIVADQIYAEAVEIETKSGSINCGSLKGNAFLKTVSGSIAVETATGADADSVFEIKSSSGKLDLGEITATEILLTSESGTIHVGQLCGDVTFCANSSYLSVAKFIGAGEFQITSGKMDVSVLEANGMVQLSSDSGSIHLGLPTGYRGYFFAESQSGSIHTPFKNMEVETEGHISGEIGIGGSNSIYITSGSGKIQVK